MNKKYFRDFFKKYSFLKNCEISIMESINILTKTFKKNNNQKIFLAGNGGSGSDSDHIACELLKNFIIKRKNKNQNISLNKYFFKKIQMGLPAISLNSFNPSFFTAFSNDCDGSYYFSQLLYTLGSKNDIFFAITTSGRSPNILHAIEMARLKKMHIICLMGDQNILLKKKVDIMISVNKKEVYQIQEAHRMIYHLICKCIEENIFA